MNHSTQQSNTTHTLSPAAQRQKKSQSHQSHDIDNSKAESEFGSLQLKSIESPTLSFSTGAGNGGDESGISTGLKIQPSLSYSQNSNDPCEQEADSISQKLSESSLNKSVIQKKPSESDTTTSVSSDIEHTINQSKGTGQPLGTNIRSSMEQRFGHDFSNVSIHTDNSAMQMNQSLNAQAFTVGNDIFFNSGKYRPHDSQGQQLLAHELTHTVQQQGSQGVQRIQRAPLDQKWWGDEKNVDLFEKLKKVYADLVKQEAWEDNNIKFYFEHIIKAGQKYQGGEDIDPCSMVTVQKRITFFASRLDNFFLTATASQLIKDSPEQKIYSQLIIDIDTILSNVPQGDAFCNLIKKVDNKPVVNCASARKKLISYFTKTKSTLNSSKSLYLHLMLKNFNKERDKLKHNIVLISNALSGQYLLKADDIDTFDYNIDVYKNVTAYMRKNIRKDMYTILEKVCDLPKGIIEDYASVCSTNSEEDKKEDPDKKDEDKDGQGGDSEKEHDKKEEKKEQKLSPWAKKLEKALVKKLEIEKKANPEATDLPDKIEVVQEGTDKDTFVVKVWILEGETWRGRTLPLPIEKATTVDDLWWMVQQQTTKLRDKKSDEPKEDKDEEPQEPTPPNEEPKISEEDEQMLDDLLKQLEEKETETKQQLRDKKRLIEKLKKLSPEDRQKLVIFLKEGKVEAPELDQEELLHRYLDMKESEREALKTNELLEDDPIVGPVELPEDVKLILKSHIQDAPQMNKDIKGLNQQLDAIRAIVHEANIDLPDDFDPEALKNLSFFDELIMFESLLAGASQKSLEIQQISRGLTTNIRKFISHIKEEIRWLMLEMSLTAIVSALAAPVTAGGSLAANAAKGVILIRRLMKLKRLIEGIHGLYNIADEVKRVISVINTADQKYESLRVEYYKHYATYKELHKTFKALNAASEIENIDEYEKVEALLIEKENELIELVQDKMGGSFDTLMEYLFIPENATEEELKEILLTIPKGIDAFQSMINFYSSMDYESEDEEKSLDQTTVLANKALRAGVLLYPLVGYLARHANEGLSGLIQEKDFLDRLEEAGEGFLSGKKRKKRKVGSKKARDERRKTNQEKLKKVKKSEKPKKVKRGAYIYDPGQAKKTLKKGEKFIDKELNQDSPLGDWDREHWTEKLFKEEFKKAFDDLNKEANTWRISARRKKDKKKRGYPERVAPEFDFKWHKKLPDGKFGGELLLNPRAQFYADKLSYDDFKKGVHWRKSGNKEFDKRFHAYLFTTMGYALTKSKKNANHIRLAGKATATSWSTGGTGTGNHFLHFSKGKLYNDFDKDAYIDFLDKTINTTDDLPEGYYLEEVNGHKVVQKKFPTSKRYEDLHLDEKQTLKKGKGKQSDLPPTVVTYGGTKAPQGWGISMTAKSLTQNGPDGQPANRAKFSAYWNKIVKRQTGDGSMYVRGHLLNEGLHGPAKWENLVPFTQGANAEHREDVEKKIKTKVSMGKVVYYNVDTDYNFSKVSELTQIVSEAEKQSAAATGKEKERYLLIRDIAIIEQSLPESIKCSAYAFDGKQSEPKPYPYLGKSEAEIKKGRESELKKGDPIITNKEIKSYKKREAGYSSLSEYTFKE